MLNATMYQRNRCTIQPGRKLTTAGMTMAHGGSSSAAPRKMTRLGWNEKFAGAKTSNRLPDGAEDDGDDEEGDVETGPGVAQHFGSHHSRGQRQHRGYVEARANWQSGESPRARVRHRHHSHRHGAPQA